MMYIYDTETHGECERKTDIYNIYKCFNILIFIYHGIDLSIILSTISYLFIYLHMIYSFVTYLYNGTKKKISIYLTLLLGSIIYT